MREDGGVAEREWVRRQLDLWRNPAIAAKPKKSNRAIAKEIGVGKDTVRKVREAGGDQSPPAREGRDGKIYRPPVRDRMLAQIASEIDDLVMGARDRQHGEENGEVGGLRKARQKGFSPRPQRGLNRSVL